MKTRRSLTCGIVKKIAVVVVSEKKKQKYISWRVICFTASQCGSWGTGNKSTLGGR